jgi:hypothetical protein
MPAFGIDWLAPVRSFRNFFGTYGTTQGSIRGVLNAIVPVAIVDRYRDDEEGSLFALTATANVNAGDHAAFVFGSPSDDWELYAVNKAIFFPNGLPTDPTQWLTFNLMMYTPDSTYQPVEFPSPAGLYVPGLNLDWAFTVGSVTGIAGYNTTLPPRFGCFPFETQNKAQTSANLPGPDFHTSERVFDPPIRVYRDVSLGFIMIGTFNKDYDVSVSIRYRLRQRTTDGPRTGA